WTAISEIGAPLTVAAMALGSTGVGAGGLPPGCGCTPRRAGAGWGGWGAGGGTGWARGRGGGQQAISQPDERIAVMGPSSFRAMDHPCGPGAAWHRPRPGEGGDDNKGRRYVREEVRPLG